MKEFVFLLALGLINFNSFSQSTISSSDLIHIGVASSYSENKELSQYVFNYFNDYRNSIGLADFVWNDVAYTSAKTWNIFLAKNNVYGHSRNMYECDYEIINGTITNESYLGNEFQNNVIGNDFGFGGSQNQGNVINEAFQFNTIGQFMYNNVIGNYFTYNTIGDNFESNAINNYFIGNAISNNFESNEIGDYFGNNGGLIQNVIFSNFKYWTRT